MRDLEELGKLREFKKAIGDFAESFRNLDGGPVRIISHLDSDGISAAAILIRALQKKNTRFAVSIIKQLDKDVLRGLSMEHYKTIFFTDLGAGQLSDIKKSLDGKKVFILDHHKLEENVEVNGISLIHPGFFDIDGGKEISGAGVTYLFAKELNEDSMNLAHLAVIGAIGDVQEEKGFIGVNKRILEDAVNIGKIEVKIGLRIFGAQTRPIHKVLEYSTNPYIPGVSGSEQGALNFLSEIGLKLKEGNEWKKLIDLDKEDMRKLVTGIIVRRIGSEKKPEDVIGPVYILTEEEDGPTKDAKEFSTLLNACGRLKKESFGLGTCLGDIKMKEKAIVVLRAYRKEIMEALNWFNFNKGNPQIVIEKKGFTIINAGDNIRDTLIGTLSSIIAKSNVYKEGSIILALAHTLDENTKVSIRVCGFNEKKIDLKQILSDIASKIGEGAGGHAQAAGTIIPQEKEIQFIKESIEILKSKQMEEVVE